MRASRRWILQDIVIATTTYLFYSRFGGCPENKFYFSLRFFRIRDFVCHNAARHIELDGEYSAFFRLSLFACAVWRRMKLRIPASAFVH